MYICCWYFSEFVSVESGAVPKKDDWLNQAILILLYEHYKNNLKIDTI